VKREQKQKAAVKNILGCPVWRQRAYGRTCFNWPGITTLGTHSQGVKERFFLHGEAGRHGIIRIAAPHYHDTSPLQRILTVAGSKFRILKVMRGPKVQHHLFVPTCPI
jgi:hypothetical protein